MPWRETPADLNRALAEECRIVPAPDGDLYGIFTPPAPEAAPANRCVVIISRPRYEYHRLSVEIARRLATLGFSCFRFDYHGWGDSEGETVPLRSTSPTLRISTQSSSTCARRSVSSASSYGAAVSTR